ncbi:MAG: DUF3343 domain-containing protein [Clostridia bacterium]|nr:DUF3343 domain-containing protein [Clostridia bacterium]
MSRSILKIGAVNQAIRARRLLQDAGISAETVKVGVADSRFGCQYGVRFDTAETQNVCNILRYNGIRIEKIQNDLPR